MLTYIDISTHFLFEKDNKVPRCEDADKLAANYKDSRPSGPKCTKVNLKSETRSPYAAPAPLPPLGAS